MRTPEVGERRLACMFILHGQNVLECTSTGVGVEFCRVKNAFVTQNAYILRSTTRTQKMITRSIFICAIVKIRKGTTTLRHDTARTSSYTAPSSRKSAASNGRANRQIRVYEWA